MTPAERARLCATLLEMEAAAWALGGDPYFETVVYADSLGCSREAAAAQLRVAEREGWVEHQGRRRGPGVDVYWVILVSDRERT